MVYDNPGQKYNVKNLTLEYQGRPQNLLLCHRVLLQLRDKAAKKKEAIEMYTQR